MTPSSSAVSSRAVASWADTRRGEAYHPELSARLTLDSSLFDQEDSRPAATQVAGGGVAADACPDRRRRACTAQWLLPYTRTRKEHEMLDVVIAWLDAMRRGDADAAAEHFDPDVTWYGVPADVVCRSRAEVAVMLARTIARGRPEAEALELIAGRRAVVLAVRSPDLREIGDVPLPGQLYNVFEVRDGVIVAARDFVERDDALRAAQADAPAWE